MSNQQETIKVFISSKCGGEHINLGISTADLAVRTNYDVIRRALKLRLEATSFIQVYVFEVGSASSMSAQDEYLYKIDDSDV